MAVTSLIEARDTAMYHSSPGSDMPMVKSNTAVVIRLTGNEVLVDEGREKWERRVATAMRV